MTDVTQCLTARTGQRGDLDTESFILENAEPLQPVVGTLSPGAHGSGPGTVNGQDAYTGQLVPIDVCFTNLPTSDIAGTITTEHAHSLGDQMAVTGRLIPVQVTTAGGRELGDVAQTVLRYYGQGSDLDTQSWVVQDERWAGSASQDDIAAPLLNAGAGGARTSDIDGATWVIEQETDE